MPRRPDPTDDRASTARLGFWLRWSWRDLRERWVAVGAIALVLAIAVGVQAGLGSTSAWRRESNDASFALLRMHDLRVALSPGTFVEAGVLSAAVADLPDADRVEAAVERIVVDSQLEASGPEGPVLVYTRLVGMPMDPLGPDVVGGAVDAVWLDEGALPPATGAVGILEAKFADEQGLPTQGTITVSGGHQVDYHGVGFGPEEFYVTGPEGMIFAGADVATVYVPLDDAGRIAGRPGQVNDLVLRLVQGVDDVAMVGAIEDRLGELGVSATVTTRADADAFRILYEDIDNDQQFWNALSGLVFAAGALAAFNLVTRIVEAQRREIGIGMALGVRRWELSIRPVLVGVQIAVLATALGLGVGVLVGQAMVDLLHSVLPLPIYRTPFQTGVFARAALLAVAIPVAASTLPVWRAVRVEPIDAIRTGHLTARPSRLASWTTRVRWPGSSLTLLPVRNLLRTPRRTVLTAVGVGAAITALVGTLGMLDSFRGVIDQGAAEVTRGDPDRVIVQLDGFHPRVGGPVEAVVATDSVGRADPAIRVPATIGSPGAPDEFDIVLELDDLDNPVPTAWRPDVDRRVETGERPGILLADKAADDLGVGLGDAVAVRHPHRDPSGRWSLAVTEFVVAGLHGNPIRTFAFADLEADRWLGLEDVANVVHAYPAPGSSRALVQREVFALPGVASSQAVARISEVFDEALGQFVGFIAIAATAVLGLALLIAFNASRITVEERRREHATMCAFGVPLRSVLGVIVRESVLIGVLATVVGIVTGRILLQWMLDSIAARTLPEIGVPVTVGPVTVVIAAAVGIIAVGVAPLLVARRLWRMNVPDMLRVME